MPGSGCLVCGGWVISLEEANTCVLWAIVIVQVLEPEQKNVKGQGAWRSHLSCILCLLEDWRADSAVPGCFAYCSLHWLQSLRPLWFLPCPTFKVCCSPGAIRVPVSLWLRARLFSQYAIRQVSRDEKKPISTFSKIAGLWWNLEVLLVEEACFPDPSRWRWGQPFLSIFGFTDTVQNLVWFTAFGFVPQEILQMAFYVAFKLIWYLVCLVLTNFVPAVRKIAKSGFTVM